MINRLIPRQASLLGEPRHRLNQLIHLPTEQHLTIARLNRLDPIGRADIPVLHGDLVGQAVNRQAQIVHLAADHQIQGIDRHAKERSVLVPRERIGIPDRVLAIASPEIVEIITRAARQDVIAGAAGELIGATPSCERVVPGTTKELIIA